MPETLQARAELPPRCREVETLDALIEARAQELPERAPEWRRFLDRVREDAVDGVLPESLDPVLRTIFHDLIYAGDGASAAAAEPKPRRARFRRPGPAKQPSKQPSKQPPEEPPLPPADLPPAAVLPLASGWEAPRLLEWAPVEVAEPPPAAVEPPPPPPRRRRRELRLPRPALPSRPRLPRAGGTASGVLGLRIGSSQLAAALVHNDGAPELRRLARCPLPPGLVEGGEVRDPDALARELDAFFSRNRLPRRRIRLGVATNRIGVRVLEVPAGEDERTFANAVRFHVQEVMPIPLREAVLDHVVLGERAGDGGTVRRVLVVFAHRELVDGYVAACRRARLALAGIDFDAFALLRALGAGRGDGAAGSALVAVAVGHERTIFAVAEGAVCDFARVLDWGGGNLDAAVAETLGIGAAEAGELKRAISLDGTGPGAPAQADAAREALRRELQPLARELVSSLHFYQSRPASLDIGQVVVTGGGSELHGLAAELERQMGVPVRLGDPLAHVALGPGIEFPEQLGSLAIAIGLGVEAA